MTYKRAGHGPVFQRTEPQPTRPHPGSSGAPAKNANGPSAPVCLQFRCECGGILKAQPGHTKPWVWACTRGGGGLEVVQANAAAHGLDWRKVLDDPLLLGEPLQACRRTAATPVDPDYIARCPLLARTGRAGAEARTYLTSERGIGRRVLRTAGVRWDSAARRLVFPFDREGETYAYKTRLPRPGAQMLACPGSGRPWWLYPGVPEGDWALLVAGELDALRGLSAGLPAVSVPLGAGTWRDDWTEALRAKTVAVCFDNNEGRFARRRVDALRSAGIDAYRVRLCRRLGPKADLSDFLNAGGDPERLRRRAVA